MSSPTGHRRTSPCPSAADQPRPIVRVDNPRLWSTTDPYLYTRADRGRTGPARRSIPARATFGSAGWRSARRRVSRSTGSRSSCTGVDLHNDEGALGSVDNYDAMWRQMSKLKAMGVNAFRTSHNPPSPEMIDICQRLGIVMMVEAFDAWDVGKLSQDYHLYFNQWSDSDITEMVNAAKNSPAVIMWSIGNEIPDLTSAAGPSDRAAADRRRQVDRHHPPGRRGLGQVPQRPASRARRPTRCCRTSTVSASTTTRRRRSTACTRSTRPSSSSSRSRPRRPRRAAYYQDPGQLNTGQNFTPGKYGSPPTTTTWRRGR